MRGNSSATKRVQMSNKSKDEQARIICILCIVCKYAHMHIALIVESMNACMHESIFVILHVCIYESMHICKYASTQVCKYASMPVLKYACMHVCMYLCMHIWVTGTRTGEKMTKRHFFFKK